MYKCQITKRVSRPGEKCNKVVVQTREKTYYQKVWEEGQLVDLEIGKGFETVKEISVSSSGLEIWNNWSDEERRSFLRTL